MKIPLIRLRVNINIKTSPDETGKSCFLTVKSPSHSSSAPYSSMQIIPAECRYLGLFVMVEVYHSLRLCCAASHELMMNAGGDGKSERERADSCREATQRQTGEQWRESEISRRPKERLNLWGKMRRRRKKDWRETEAERQGKKEREWMENSDEKREGIDQAAYYAHVLIFPGCFVVE